MFSKNIKIADLNLTQTNKALVIAEIGINHEGNYQKCLDMILSAKRSGADLVKLQVADPSSDYSNKTKSYKIFNSASFSREEIFNIYKFCKKKKIRIFSTFGRKNFEFFKKLNQCCFKISSSLFNDFFFIKDIIKQNKPVILSSGISELKDIDLILRLLKKEKFKKIAMLHCRSLYPTTPEKLNLSRIAFLISKYGIITGFSDHSKGTEAAIASIHYGAKIIEKHFTFDDNRKGYDHKISLKPNDFKQMSDDIRANEKMIGKHNYTLDENRIDFDKIKKVSRNFIILKDIKKNSKLKKNDFTLMRTNQLNCYSKFYKIFPKILNNKIKKNLQKGSVLKLTDFKA